MAPLPSGSIVCFASPMDRTRSSLPTLSKKDFFPRNGRNLPEEYSQIDFAYRTLIAPHVDAGP